MSRGALVHIPGIVWRHLGAPNGFVGEKPEPVMLGADPKALALNPDHVISQFDSDHVYVMKPTKAVGQYPDDVLIDLDFRCFVDADSFGVIVGRIASPVKEARERVLAAIREMCLETGDVLSKLDKHRLTPRERQVVLEWLYPEGGFPTQWKPGDET